MKSFRAYAVLLAAFIAFSCSKTEDQQQTFVSFFDGDVTIQSKGEGARPVQLRDMIRDGDIIETGKDSYLVIQAGDGIVIRIESESLIEADSITDSRNREISLNRGRLISGVSRLQRGHEYKVRTPTAVAAVRGTEFFTEYSEGRTVVAVGSGEVRVSEQKTGKEVAVETNSAAVVSEKEDEAVEVREISKIEKLEISKVRVTPVIRNYEEIETESSLYQEQFIDMQEKIQDIIREIDSQSWTLERIRREYGRIDMITLYSGRVIQGAILTRGDIVRVLTPDGVVTIPAREIRTTDVL